jgi:hypothetical protein
MAPNSFRAGFASPPVADAIMIKTKKRRWNFDIACPSFDLIVPTVRSPLCLGCPTTFPCDLRVRNNI